MSDREKGTNKFGSAVLLSRMEALHKELLGLESEITEEAVHQTRIASRRMRAALEAFREHIPARSFDSVYREVRHITRILGAPRESAVCVQLIEKLVKDEVKEDSCLQYLRKRFTSRQKKQEKQLRKKLIRIDANRLRSRLEYLISPMDAGEDLAFAGAARQSVPHKARHQIRHSYQLTLIETHKDTLSQAARVIANLIAPIIEFHIERRFDVATEEELHSLRIAAKKARYAMEMYSPIWPGGLSDRIQKARSFQQAGGKYNDLCMLCRHLDDEFNRLDSADSIHLAFEIGRLSAYAEVDIRNLKIRMRTALNEFQKSLADLSQQEKVHLTSDLHALLPAKHKPLQKKISKIVKTGR